MGRPLKFTEEEMLEAIKGSAGIISKIAERLNCGWNTAQTYINEYESCILSLKDENEKVLDLAESQMLKAIQGGDAQMIRYILSTKGKKRGYTEKMEIEDVTDFDKQREKFKSISDKFKESVNESE